jgi:hypothetical protein
MSSPWVTPPAGSDLPPRNGNVQYYSARNIYPRNAATGSSWTPGRELVFQTESSPADGWLVPSESKLYMRFKIGTKGAVGTKAAADFPVQNAEALRFAASPVYGLLDSAKYSINGTTVQSVSGPLDQHAQFQLRLAGSRESHDTNATLGCDSLRQTMLPPELLSSDTTMAAGSVDEVFHPEVVPNEKQKILSDRIGNSGEIELMTPVSLALTSWGQNKFIAGASHDLRFTVGEYGVNMKRSVYTEVVEPRAIGQATVLSDAADDAGLKLDGITMNAAANVPVTTGSDQDATILAMKRRTAADIGAGNTDHVGNYDAATVANKKLARARMLARCAPGIPLYDDTGDAELKIDMVECYLSCVFVMPVHGTVQRPLSWQGVYDNIHLVQEPVGALASFVKNLTIPVNTTRIVIGFSPSSSLLTTNRELLGARGGTKIVKDPDAIVPVAERGNEGTPTSLSITIGGVSLPAPAYTLSFKSGTKKGEQTLRAWSDWQSFLKASISSTVGSQNLSEWQEAPLWAFRVMGDGHSSVSQNLTVRASFTGPVAANTDMQVFCIGTNVVEMTYDDDASFQPTSVSVQEVI